VKPSSQTIGHSLEAYLRSREVVYGKSNYHNNLAKYPNRIKLQTHRRVSGIDDGFVTFRKYKKRGD